MYVITSQDYHRVHLQAVHRLINLHLRVMLNFYHIFIVPTVVAAGYRDVGELNIYDLFDYKASEQTAFFLLDHAGSPICIRTSVGCTVSSYIICISLVQPTDVRCILAYLWLDFWIFSIHEKYYTYLPVYFLIFVQNRGSKSLFIPVLMVSTLSWQSKTMQEPHEPCKPV